MKARNTFYTLTRALRSRKLKISVMESCTSGCISSLITDTEGASGIFPGSVVTYSNDTKELFHVPKEVIDEHGVYSEETAIAMASASRELFDTDIGVGVTGTLGRLDPMNSDSVSGVVHYAIDFKGDIRAFTIPKIDDERHFAKYIVAENVGTCLISLLLE